MLAAEVVHSPGRYAAPQRRGYGRTVTVLIDPPIWQAHGRLWSHLASDSDLEELHELAARVGLDRRLFEGDHYDVPQERYAEVVAAGATEVSGSELVRRLRDSGLRFRKRRGERPLSRTVNGLAPLAPVPHVLDLVGSPHERGTAGAAIVLIRTQAQASPASPPRMVLVRQEGRGFAPPGGKRDAVDQGIRHTAVREVAEEVGLFLATRSLTPVGYERITLAPGHGHPTWDDGDNYLQVYAADVPSALALTPDLAEVLEARWFTEDEARSQSQDEPWWPLVDWWWRRAGASSPPGGSAG